MTRKYTSLPYTEYDVAYGHYDTTRNPITMIVLHSSASTRQGLIDTFAGGTRMVSAHYGVDNDGSLLAFLEEYYTAYHSGNYGVNQKSIGIEHIDNAVKLHSDQQYEMSAKLVADICKFYNIPCDVTHVVPHSSIVATSCPNRLDIGRIINSAKQILKGNPTPPMNNDTRKAGQFNLIVNSMFAAKLLPTDNSDALLDNDPVAGAVKNLIKDDTDKQAEIVSLNDEIEILNKQISDEEIQYKALDSLLQTNKAESDAKLADCEASRQACEAKQPIIKTVEVPIIQKFKSKLGKTFYKLAQEFG